MKKLLLLLTLLPCPLASASAQNAGQPAPDGLPPIFAPAGDALRLNFQLSPVFRIKGDNTNSTLGLEGGVTAAYENALSSLGLFAGYYAPDSRSGGDGYELVPVTLRATLNLPIEGTRARFLLAAEGGYCINSMRDTSPSVSDVRNSYVLGGQFGFRYTQPENKFALEFTGGYQYLKPEVTGELAAGSSRYLDLSAPFIKFTLEI